jgi:hypothetical protein
VLEHAAELPDGIGSSDTLSYQLPQVARWIQTGSLWQLDQFFPDYSNATYPHHGQLLLLAVVLPFRAVFLARLVPVPYLGLTALAVYAAARELGAVRAWAALGAALALAVPIFVLTGITGANTDTPMTFFTASALLFLLRHHRTGAHADLLLAGLACGLALGTKWYAITMLAALLGTWLACTRLDRRRVARPALWLGGLTLAVAGLWLLRNLVEAGNPIFPQKLPLFNSPPDPLRELYGWSLAHYLFDLDIWREYLWPQFRHFMSAPGFVLALAPLIVVVVARRERVRAVAVAALLMSVAYLFTTYSALGPEDQPVSASASMRYEVPALLLGATCVAWLGTRLRRTGPLPALAALVAVVLGTWALYGGDLTVGAIVVGAAVAGLVTLGARRWGQRATVVVGVSVALLGVVKVRHDATGRGYGPRDPVLAWIEANAATDTRIALAGTWPASTVAPVLPAFGPRLENDVVYAGPFVDSMLRAETDADRFARRLDGFDLVIVGRGPRPSTGPAAEEEWAEAAGFAPVVSSPSLALLAR